MYKSRHCDMSRKKTGTNKTCRSPDIWIFLISSLISTSPSKLDLEGIAAESENSRKAIKCLSSPGFFQPRTWSSEKISAPNRLESYINVFSWQFVGCQLSTLIIQIITNRTLSGKKWSCFCKTWHCQIQRAQKNILQEWPRSWRGQRAGRVPWQSQGLKELPTSSFLWI